LSVGWASKIQHFKKPTSAGNVAFADGWVSQLTSPGLVLALNNSGDTNTVSGANVILFP
jgi:hypothetical protein